MKPRGRVFYQPADDQYIIAVGSWIDQSSEAIGQIIEEFDLPKAKTIVKKASHENQGVGECDHFLRPLDFSNKA